MAACCLQQPTMLAAAGCRCKECAESGQQCVVGTLLPLFSLLDNKTQGAKYADVPGGLLALSADPCSTLLPGGSESVRSC